LLRGDSLIDAPADQGSGTGTGLKRRRQKIG
jgi:hypothetical protein